MPTLGEAIRNKKAKRREAERTLLDPRLLEEDRNKAFMRRQGNSGRKRSSQVGPEPPFIFTDDFNRANESLEANASWTRVDGSVGGASISNNQLAANDTSAGGTSYHAPDTGSADHYVQAAWIQTTGAVGPFICCRLTDANNFVGTRWNGTINQRWEIYKRVAGSFTLLGSFDDTITSGDVVRLECSGDTARVLLNDAEIIAPASLSGSHAGVTTSGLVARVVAHDPLIDDFETGVV